MESHFENHSGLSHPSDATTIWRYMDISKYIHLLSTQKLYFSRIDKLKDKKEGAIPPGQEFHREQALSRYPSPELKEFYEDLLGYLQINRKATYVNCWNVSAYESNLMWRFYVDSSYGVAIKSTYGKLKNALKLDTEFLERNAFTIGMVGYYNPDTDGLPIGNMVHPFFLKTHEYVSENELRALIQMPFTDPSVKTGSTPGEYLVPVDLNELIEEVVLSPTSPTWHKEIYEEINRMYLLKKEVFKSRIEMIG
jgi:hypothetical protein